ncbi:MAG: hypothetical protein N4A65_14065 [Cohaesibacter sp.]|jgi:O-antigen/teichoic acid export membrane protein|nr:hypothetical protein [Cohaesibacter sp.]
MIGPQLQRLFSQMMLLTSARVAGSICVFVTTLMITRLCGPQMLAQYSLYLAIASLLSVLLPCGFQAIGSMMAAEYQEQSRKAVLAHFIAYGRKLILFLGIGLGGALLLLMPLIPQGDYNLSQILPFAIPTAIGMAFIYFHGSILIGLQHQFAGQLPEILLRPVLVLLVVAILALTVPEAQSWQLILVITSAISIAALVQWRALQARKPHTAPQADSSKQERVKERKGWWKMAPSWSLITLMWDYFIELHILLASLFFLPFEIALLHICFRIRQLAGFGMKALYSLLMPKIFSANAAHKNDETKQLIRLATRVTLVYALAAWISIALLGPYILGLFGDDFRNGQTILLIIMATLPIRALFGPAPAILGMKRNHRWVVLILAASLLLSIALIAGGVQYGLTIVAIGYLAATAFTAIAMWASAKHKSGINCAVWA